MKKKKLISTGLKALVVIVAWSSLSFLPEKDSIMPKRFFSDDSFWNQPIGANPEIDADSDKWIKMLALEPTGEHFSTIFKKWTIPVYEVDENTPLVKVGRLQLTEDEKVIWNTKRDFWEHGPDFNPLPMPIGAKPDKEVDAHIAVIDWKRMLAWDSFALKQKEDGSWVASTGMVYRLDGSGVFDGKALGYMDDESVHFHGPSRAAGVPVIAGLIRYDEVMAGRIRHKLSCATRFAATKTFVYPASWTDGFVDGGIPEGAVIQLNPSLDLSQFSLTKEEVVVAKALQNYGMVVVDIAQGQPIYAEALWGHPDKTWEGKLTEWDNDKGINSIPFKHYRVLKVNNPVYKGDSRTQLPRHRDVWLPKSMLKND